jgi:histone-lysine N-methyltransferase SETMAR
MLACVADIMVISYGSAQATVHDDLGYHKVCAQWVPKQLTAQHKQQHADVVTQFLKCYEEDPGILEQIVTGDETWVHHYKLESKRQSVEWKHPSSPVRNKFKQQPSCKKLMLMFFWVMQGPILVKFQAHGETVNSAKYSALLYNQLKPAVHHKRRGLLSKGVLLLHNNVWPHTATPTEQTMLRLGFELLPHPPHSHNLAPSDYHIFGPLKETLRDHRFSSHGDIQ